MAKALPTWSKTGAAQTNIKLLDKVEQQLCIATPCKIYMVGYFCTRFFNQARTQRAYLLPSIMLNGEIPWKIGKKPKNLRMVKAEKL